MLYCFTLARASDSVALTNWQNFINGSWSYAQLILLGFFPFRSSANGYHKFFRDVIKYNDICNNPKGISCLYNLSIKYTQVID